MSDLASLLIGIATLVGALTSAFVLVWTTVRHGRRPERVARSAAEESAAAVVEALADGQLSAAELDKISAAIRRQHDERKGDTP